MDMISDIIMITINNYDGTIDELVFNIGNLQYDNTSLILKKIATNIKKKAYDTNSLKLKEISYCIFEAAEHLDDIWKYCKDRTDCSKHPSQIQDFYGTIDGLAIDISSGSDKDLVVLSDKLGDDFLKQADADWKRGNKKVATGLYSAANCLYKIKMEL
jgi:hypothetical protein